jgi:hypothetical protein
MKKYRIIFLWAAVLAGCQETQEVIDPQMLDALSVNAAVADVQRYLGEDSRIMAICGPSTGSLLFLDKDGAKLERDEIKDGVVGLGFDKSGKPDIVRRDAFKTMIRLSEDGGLVNYIPSAKQDGLGTWTINYPSTGVSESYVLSKSSDGSVVSIWTSAKPKLDETLPPRGLLMYSKCNINDAQTH